jgi:plasmid stabilization system protein ParE
MSAFQVEFTRNASADFDDAVDWYGERSIEVAARWIEEIEKALDALEQTPHRFPPARESAKLGVPLRELAIGAGKRLTHRMVGRQKLSCMLSTTLRGGI